MSVCCKGAYLCRRCYAARYGEQAANQRFSAAKPAAVNNNAAAPSPACRGGADCPCASCVDWRTRLVPCLLRQMDAQPVPVLNCVGNRITSPDEDNVLPYVDFDSIRDAHASPAILEARKRREEAEQADLAANWGETPESPAGTAFIPNHVGLLMIRNGSMAAPVFNSAADDSDNVFPDCDAEAAMQAAASPALRRR